MRQRDWTCLAVFVWYLDTNTASETERLDMLGCVCLVSGHKESESDREIGHAWLCLSGIWTQGQRVRQRDWTCLAVFVWYLDTNTASETERLDMLGCVCLVSRHKESELDREIGHAWLCLSGI